MSAKPRQRREGEHLYTVCFVAFKRDQLRPGEEGGSLKARMHHMWLYAGSAEQAEREGERVARQFVPADDYLEPHAMATLVPDEWLRYSPAIGPYELNLLPPSEKYDRM